MLLLYGFQNQFHTVIILEVFVALFIVIGLGAILAIRLSNTETQILNFVKRIEEEVLTICNRDLSRRYGVLVVAQLTEYSHAST